MPKHRHVWFYVERGHGVGPKENDPDPVLFNGHLAQCECGKKMFFPDNPKLKPQDIEE